MKYIQSNIPLGCNMQPFGALRKCDETTDSSFWSGAGGAAVIGAGSSLIGSLISAGANNYYQMQASEANYEMQKRQLEWNEAMVDKTNKYNSPKAEYNRLLEAGINPILAKYRANAGSVSASPVPQGVNPPYNQIGVNDTGKLLGLGVNDAVQNYLAMKANEREDYKLASQITFDDFNTRLKYLEYRLHKSKNESESAYIKKQMEALDEEMALNRDKFALGVEWQNFQKNIEEYRARQTDQEIAIKQYLAANEVSLGAASIEKLAAETNYLYHEAFEMQANGVSQREINDWISKQEQMINNIIHDDELQKKFNNKKGLGVYTRFTRWMLDPIKGVLSGNASIKPK